jgi:RNA polymerase sigma-32 factor
MARPLLSPASEAFMADDRIESTLRRAAAEAPLLDAATEADYLRRIHEHDDKRALQALVGSHLRMVLSVAAKYRTHGASYEDLVAEGNLGLLEAVRRFDREKGVRFSTYAGWWVRALIRRFAFDNRRVVGAPSTRNTRRLLSTLRMTERRLTAELGAPPTRERIASELGVSIDDVTMVEASLKGRDVAVASGEGSIELRSELPSPEQAAAEHQERATRVRAIKAALRRLDARERDIVERRALAEQEHTLKQIGTSMGLSRERVRQLEARAHDKLRVALLDQVA